ncbi:MAG: extracellular solute-binding protein [Caldilineaceae bacterium]|nr:extracellular solute-binding protein [Caldilineaceae bacterium]
MQEELRKKAISRRTFLRLSAGVAGVAALAGCAPVVPASSPQGEEVSAPAAQAVEIDVWTGWTEDAATNIEKILDGYNQSQDRVVARHVVVPEAMTQRLLAAIAAGDPPAGAIVFGASVAYQLAAQDAVLALDEIGNPDQVASLKDWMEPALWELGVYDGRFVYASMWNQCLGVFVNVDIAEQQGVDPESPPATLEELEAVWDQLTIWDNNDNIDVLGGDFTWTAMIMGRFLGQFVSEDGTTITANHPNNVRALDWIASRWQRIGPQKLQDFYASLQGRGERSAGQDPFLSGLRATTVTGPWQYNTMRNFMPEGFRYTVWPFPGPAGQTEKGMHTYGDGWIIPRGAPEPSATWEIISTMTGATGNRDVYTSLFTTWLCVNGPVSQEMTEWPTFQTEVMDECPGYEEIFLSDLYDSDYYLYPPKIPTSNSYQSLMNAEWEKVRLGQKGTQEALDFVTAEAQKELDTWNEQNRG